MELSNQLLSSHPLTAPVHPPERVTGPPELHHSEGRYLQEAPITPTDGLTSYKAKYKKRVITTCPFNRLCVIKEQVVIIISTVH